MSAPPLDIAIIDDNFAVRQSLKVFISKFLSDLGLESRIYSAADGVEGIGYVLVTTPQIIVLDTSLPTYTGRQIIDYIKTNPKFARSNIKVIVISDGVSREGDTHDNLNYLNKQSPFFMRILERYFYLALGGYAPENGRWLSENVVGRTLGSIVLNANRLEITRSQVAEAYFIPWKLVTWVFLQFQELFVHTLLGALFMMIKVPGDVNATQMRIDKRIFQWRVYPLTVISVVTGWVMMVAIVAFLVISGMS